MVLDLIGGDTRERSWQVLNRGGMPVSTLGQPNKQQAAKSGVRACDYETATRMPRNSTRFAM